MPMIPLSEIAPDPHNVRVGPPPGQKDEDLVASIREQGVLQPILVRLNPNETLPVKDGRPIYMVVCGHRRFEAARAAGLAAVPAEVREFANDGEVRLAQMAENTRRADMSLVDVWMAVESAAAAGLSPDTIALAMNRSKRDVDRFRAMGRLHPDLQALIRERGEAWVPATEYMRVIAQAPPAEQAKALDAAMKSPGSGHSPAGVWQLAANILAVKRIPMKHARFDRKLYTGKVFGDLFAAEEDNEQAEDVDLFLRLQGEWAAAEVERRSKQGWGAAVLMERTEYGTWARPKEAGPHGYLREFDEDTKPPKKAQRAALVYAVGVHPDGRAAEGMWPKKAEAVAEDGGGKREAPALGVPPKPAAPEAGLLTKDGVVALEKAKRRALSDAMGGNPRRDLQGTAVALIALLHEQVKGYQFGVTGLPRLEDLMDDEGRLNPAVAEDDVLAFAQALIGYGAKAKASLRTVELVGDFLCVPVSYPTDPEHLGHLKREAVEKVLRSINQSNLPTVKAGRAHIGKKLDAIGPQHLSLVDWQVEPLPSHYKRTGVGKPAKTEADVFGEGVDEYPDPKHLTLEQLHELLEVEEESYTHEELRAELARRGDGQGEVLALTNETGPVEAAVVAAREDAEMDEELEIDRQALAGEFDQEDAQDEARAAGPNEAAFRAWKL